MTFINSMTFPLAGLHSILCFVDCVSLYNLVNRTNMVHNFV